MNLQQLRIYRRMYNKIAQIFNFKFNALRGKKLATIKFYSNIPITTLLRWRPAINGALHGDKVDINKQPTVLVPLQTQTRIQNEIE